MRRLTSVSFRNIARRCFAWRRAVPALSLLGLACASGALAPPSSTGAAPAHHGRRSTTTAEAVAANATEPEATATAAADTNAPPAIWQEALDRYASTCSGLFFTLAKPETVTTAGLTFTLSGSTLTLAPASPSGAQAHAPAQLKIG